MSGDNAPFHDQAGSQGASWICKVAIVGYGRFGRALGGLLLTQQIEVRAFDPHLKDDPTLCSNLGRALRGADLVIFAVPVATLHDALAAARPLLGPEQIVIDVGSVKVLPTEQLAHHCGEGVPWVATHPLFGPDSLALGEQPLSVVVCPNEMHPQAVSRVEVFYRSLGCVVRLQGPPEHDQLMAETHALAFFIAKALVDLGIDRRVEAAPPSFRALARTIESVRADAGHLVGTIQRANPFAGQARRRFIEALEHLDQRIAVKGEVVAVPRIADVAGVRSVESSDPHGDSSQTVAQRIDDVDRALMILLARRARLSAAEAAGSGEHPMEALAQGGEHAVAAFRGELGRGPEDHRAWAIAEGLDPDAVEGIFREIFRMRAVDA